MSTYSIHMLTILTSTASKQFIIDLFAIGGSLYLEMIMISDNAAVASKLNLVLRPKIYHKRALETSLSATF